MTCGMHLLRISPLGAQFTNMLFAWPPRSPDATYVISFYGVTSRIRFMFLLFP